MRRNRIALWLGIGTLLALVFGIGLARAGTADPGSTGDPLVSKSYVDQYTQWRVVTVAKGQQLVGDAGLELVVRAGEAEAVASDLGGLSDLTSGADRKQNEALAANHMLLIPRGDGRGLIARSDVVLLVRGSYNLKQPGA